MKRLIELKEKFKINQTELARKIGVSQRTVSNYLNGVTEPDFPTIIKMAKVFNVSLDYLCENTTHNLIDISSWNENKKGALYLLEQLNERNDIILLGYLTHMIAEQKNAI